MTGCHAQPIRPKQAFFSGSQCVIRSCREPETRLQVWSGMGWRTLTLEQNKYWTLPLCLDFLENTFWTGWWKCRTFHLALEKMVDITRQECWHGKQRKKWFVSKHVCWSFDQKPYWIASVAKSPCFGAVKLWFKQQHHMKDIKNSTSCLFGILHCKDRTVFSSHYWLAFGIRKIVWTVTL